MKQSNIVIGYGGELDNSKEKASKPRNKIEENKPKLDEIPTKQSCITKKCIVIITIISIIILVGIILLVVFLKQGDKDPENKNSETTNTPNQDIILNEEERKKMIETEFEFNTKVGDLNRINVQQKYTEEITSYGEKYFQYVNRRTLYDIYIISETPSAEETKYFYNTTYTAAILISSQCATSNNEDCEPQKKMDLTEFSKKNLRFLAEIPDLKDAPLPLCIFNITNNDAITSIACHESLPTSIKKNMILDLYFFRPPAIKRPDKERNNVTITKSKRDGFEFIREINGGICDVEDSFNSFCTTDMNTTVDSEGRIVSYDEQAFSNITQDINNSYIKNKITNLKDESEKIADVNRDTYKQILEALINKLNPYLKYYEQFSTENFKELYKVSKNASLDNDKRNLQEQTKEFSIEDILFNYTHYSDIKLFINLRNTPGYNVDQMGAAVILEVNQIEKEIMGTNKRMNFNIIKNLFRKLSKAGNEEAYELYDKIKMNFENINDAVINNITKLMNLIMNEEIKSLSNIFDATYNMEKLRILPMTLVHESTNLKEKLENAFNFIKNDGMKSKTGPLNEEIYTFILKSHNLVDDAFQNIRSLSRLLKSSKSKLTEISTYYLNNTPYSFLDIIEESQNLLSNYYKDEENLIFEDIDSLINDFTNSLQNSIKSGIVKIDNLLENLENENMNVSIESGNKEDKNLLISNLKDSKDIINSIISKVEETVKKEMDLKENGHFISDYEISSTKNSYTPDINEALETARILDDDESIDKTFDKTYGELRENYTKLMKRHIKKIEEQMPFFDNILDNSLFSEDNITILKLNISNLSLRIKESISNENDDYLKLANGLIHDFLIKNNETLNELMLNLTTIFSEDAIINLKNLYEKAFNSSLINLDNTIQKNRNLTNDYFSKLTDLFSDNEKILELLKEFESSREYIPYYYRYWTRTHYVYFTGFEDFIKTKSKTQTYLNKYKKFKESIEASKEYINEQLSLELKYEYKNVITKLKDLLQIIKNSRLNDKFNNFQELKFIDENINQIDELYLIINKYFSDQLYNERYLPQLNNYKPNSIKEINRINNDIIEPNHLIINQFDTVNDYNNDFCFAFLRKITYTCTNGVIYNDDKSKDYCEIIGDDSDNYNLLLSLSIYSDQNIQNFITSFNRFHSKLNQIVVTYTNLVNELSSKLYTFEEQAISNSLTSEYYNQYKKLVNDILSEKYGDTIILYTYNFFQKDVRERANLIFDEIITEWKDFFSNFYLEINKNIDKYKNSITEFGLISNIYYGYISADISEAYYDLIMTHERNEFNNTIIYYYNNLTKSIKSEFQNIINKIPINKIGFERVLEERKNEVNQLLEELLAIITNSKNRDLSLYNQLYLLYVPFSNFFNISDILSNVRKKIKDNCKSISDKIYNLDNAKKNDMYSYIARYYLENSENGKQINDFFKEIDNVNFVYLKAETFKESLTKNWIFDQENFIKLLNNTLVENNLEISNELSSQKETYKKRLENEITKNSNFIKDNIREKINDLYKGAIKELKGKDIKTTVDDIKEIVKKIIFYLSKEKERLHDSTISYYEDYSLINQTIKDYKEKIIGNLNNKMANFINEFRNYLINVVYSGYYQANLNGFLSKIKEETASYETINLLNSSYNIGIIINQIANDLVDEYLGRAKAQIIHKAEEYIENWQILFTFEEMQLYINNEIDKGYLDLNESLKIRATVDNKMIGYNKYDLSDEIKEELDNLIKIKYDSFCGIIDDLKGYKYNNIDLRNSTEWELLSFDKVSNVVSIIKVLFNKFINSQLKDEEDKVNGFVQQAIQSNFKELINNLIPNSGKQFFDRIIAYNENFKLKNLFDNLRWTLAQSISYIQILGFFNNINQLTKDLKIKIYRMNDLDSKILQNNKKILNILNIKANDFIIDTESYITQKYRDFIITDANIALAFDDNVNAAIKKIFNIVINQIGNSYREQIEIFLKDKLISSYSKILDERTEEILRALNSQKEYLKNILDDIYAIDSDDVLNEINAQLNKTSESIMEYKNHFNEFTISEELTEYLNNYGVKEINPLFQNFQNLVNDIYKNSTFLNLDINSRDYQNAYNYKEFVKLANKTYEEIKNNYIDTIYNASNLYFENYTEKLEQRISNLNLNLRNLDDNEDIYERKIADKSLDDTFRKILNNSLQIKKFIQSYEFFNEFDKIISKSKNDLNTAYKNAKTLISNNTQEEEIKTIFETRLNDLKNYSIEYYIQLNESFYNLKNYLNFSISEINDLLNDCANITYETFRKKYSEYLNKVEALNTSLKENDYFENETEVNSQNTQFIVRSSSESMQKEFIFKYNYVYDQDENNEIKIPRLTTNIINLSRPKTLKFEIEKDIIDCSKEIEEVSIVFNNANYSVSLDFSPDSENILSTVSTLFDDYEYDIERYTTLNSSKDICIGDGITIPFMCFDKKCSKAKDKILLKKKVKIDKKQLKEVVNIPE